MGNRRDAGWRRPAAEYRDFIDEGLVGHSNAKHSTVAGRTFMVGALPRLNLNSASLGHLGHTAIEAARFTVGSRNSFHMNVSQAIELVDCAERCAGYIERLLEMGGSTKPVAFEIKAGVGAAATEAPRGTLYHGYAVDDDGIVTRGDVITPTAQDLANLTRTCARSRLRSWTGRRRSS